MSIELAAKIGAMILVYFPEMKVVSYCLQARRDRKECKNKTEILRSNLKEGLDGLLSDTQEDLAKQKPVDWLANWKKVGEIKDENYIFANFNLNVTDLYQKRSSKELKEYCGRRKHAVESISDYIDVAEKVFTDARKDISVANEKELGAAHDFIRTIERFYETSKRKEACLENELRTLETEHIGTKTATYSRRKRQELAAKQPVAKLNLTSEAISYVSSVYKKITEHPPEYDPRGHYLDNKNKWNTKLKTGKTISTSGEHKQWLGWTNDGLKVSCEYLGDSTPKPENVLKRANKAANKLNNSYSAVCYVGNEDNKEFSEFVKNFSHSNLSVFFYSLENKTLTYNTQDTKAEIFSNYFNGGNPKNIREIVASVESNGVVDMYDLSSKLGFGDCEVGKLERDVLDYAGISSYKLAKNIHGGGK